jgi:hypothetical protein
MKQPADPLRFRAALLRPAAVREDAWSFLLVPLAASAGLPSRGMTAVQGSLNGIAFRATLEPDGKKSHWMKVPRKLREAAGAEVGEVVEVQMAPAAKQPEPRVPPDLRKALASSREARATWADITVIARRDWIQWITSARQAETRARRIGAACDMLASGKRRVCCFDRSGIYSGGFCAPEAAP